MKALAKLLAVLALKDEDWRQQALCAQIDPELFFPEQGESNAFAKAMCRRCPVTRECLLAALQGGERYGIWGGMSPKERSALKRAHRGDVGAMAS